MKKVPREKTNEGRVIKSTVAKKKNLVSKWGYCSFNELKIVTGSFRSTHFDDEAVECKGWQSKPSLSEAFIRRKFMMR